MYIYIYLYICNEKAQWHLKRIISSFLNNSTRVISHFRSLQSAFLLFIDVFIAQPRRGFAVGAYRDAESRVRSVLKNFLLDMASCIFRCYGIFFESKEFQFFF